MKEIPLSQGKVALVDDEDFDWLNQWKWSAGKSGGDSQTFYAIRAPTIDGKRHYIRMHRALMGVIDHKIYVDHRDHNGLNNCRDNIRIADAHDNGQNRLKSRMRGVNPTTSKFLGVHRPDGVGKFEATIRISRFVHLGRFDLEEDAARAYDAAARIHHKEFASLNFPDEMPASLVLPSIPAVSHFDLSGNRNLAPDPAGFADQSALQ